MWTPERTKEFRDLLLQTDPVLSFAVIAGRIGMSKNACISKAHRMGFRRGHPKPRVARLRGVKPRVDKADTPKQVRSLPPNESPYAVKLFDLEPHHCRWPVGEPSDMMFCGDDKVDGHSYCQRHCRMAYRSEWKFSEEFRERRRAWTLRNNVSSMEALSRITDEAA